tara:strand:- start:278 stop:466 length:189 start_codon:yes stop_codon:yes gene_type:complete
MENLSLGDIVSVKSGCSYSGDRGMIIDISPVECWVSLWLIGKIVNFRNKDIHLIQSLGATYE